MTTAAVGHVMCRPLHILTRPLAAETPSLTLGLPSTMTYTRALPLAAARG